MGNDCNNASNGKQCPVGGGSCYCLGPGDCADGLACTNFKCGTSCGIGATCNNACCNGNTCVMNCPQGKSCSPQGFCG
jgi:hypothetical protein